MDTTSATRILVWLFRLLRHYLYRFETMAALIMFGLVWYYLKWMDNRFRTKISLAAMDLQGSMSEERRLSTDVRSWIENGFHSVDLLNRNKQTWEYKQDNVVVYAVKGLRDSMEDRFSILTDRDRWKLSIFGIFDGHGGDFAADFVERTLFKAIMHRLNVDSKDEKEPNIRQILFDEIKSTDEKLVNITEEKKDITGTTALVCVLHNNILTVANVGDSRGVLMLQDGKTIPISVDHKPNSVNERSRIKEAGGWVSFNGVWRVAGILATSRALGDYFLKNPKFVISDPDILNFDLRTVKAQFVVMATDGLWDAVSNEEAAQHVLKHLNEPLCGTKSLVELALSRGSTDNISIMVVRLGETS